MNLRYVEWMFSGEGILNLVVILAVILFSMVLHELAHGLVAYWLGDTTAKNDGRLTLNPLKHLDPVMSLILPLMMFMTGGVIFGGAKPVPVNTNKLKYGAWGMAMVAAAGPLTNFVLALMSFLIGYWTGAISVANGALYYSAGIWGLIVVEMVLVNLGFGIFNLIPIPPLDGSRILYAIAPDGVRDVMDKMERWGIVVVLMLVVVFPSVWSTILGGGVEAVLRAFGWLVGA